MYAASAGMAGGIKVTFSYRDTQTQGPVRGVIQVPRLNFKPWYVAISEGSRVAVVALVSLFQGRVACRNLPLTGP